MGYSTLNYAVVNDGPETITTVKAINTDSSIIEITGGSTSRWNASVDGAEQKRGRATMGMSYFIFSGSLKMF
ncbi:MAG: hypothetical protein COU25_02610 [Candidatus Levybacteria bacterium CG10_big_fil_rev_8_21_14_0_10_35_13]|nr:MAG: hypothetical protein COU25_02610 [Candidatus Levybacteria bacterium CG10_big_fil_rev_8_21_14_0_10_35_13]